MPLELYERSGRWWFKGRIDRIPAGKYYRQSLGIPSTAPEREAIAALAEFERQEIKRDIVGEEKALTFEDAVMLYPANPMEAKGLAAILPHLKDRSCASIKPQEVRKLGPILFPLGATDTWQRHVVTPIRAVINNAHDLGKCPPIKVKAYTKPERLKQDRIRGKSSRIEKTPGSWEWLLAFRSKANPYLKAMAYFMFVTGARIGQATALRPDDFDLQNARVWMPEAKGMEAQWVDLPMDLVVELANLRPRRPRKGPHGKARVKGEKMFGYAGKNGVYKSWKTACKKAKISEIMPHAAGRHGFATELLVRQKLDPRTVAKAGRWADMALMQKTYTHDEDTKDKVQAAFRTGFVQATAQTSAKHRKLQ